MAPAAVPLPSVTELEPLTVPDPLMAPAPVGVSVIAVPAKVTPVPTVIGLFVPVLTKASVVVAVILLVVAIPPLAESVRLMVEPVEVPFPVNARESVKVTAPVVELNVTLGVASWAVMAPPVVPLPSVTEVDPLIVPVPLMGPEPVGVNVTVVPANVAPAPTEIGLFVPVLINANVEVAVILLLVAIPPFAESVRLIVEPVEAPFPVIAVESVKTTAPVVLKVTFGVIS